MPSMDQSPSRTDSHLHCMYHEVRGGSWATSSMQCMLNKYMIVVLVVVLS